MVTCKQSQSCRRRPRNVCDTRNVRMSIHQTLQADGLPERPADGQPEAALAAGGDVEVDDGQLKSHENAGGGGGGIGSGGVSSGGGGAADAAADASLHSYAGSLVSADG